MKNLTFAIFTMVLLSACSSTLPPEVLAALTKVETVDKDANTFVMKGDWVCNSAAKDCEIRVPMGGKNPNASTEKMRMLLSYYDNQDTPLDYFAMFMPIVGQGLNIWDNNRRDKRNNKYLLKQLEVQSNEQISQYEMIGGMFSDTSSSNASISAAAFDGITQIANNNSLTLESVFASQNALTSNILTSMPESGDINNFEYHGSFNQYDGSFNPATTNQALQPIEWGGLTSFAEAFKPTEVQGE